MRRHRLHRRRGHARFGELPAARKRMHKWETYRGHTLDAWKGSTADYGAGAYEVQVFKSGWHHPEGKTFGATLNEAMKKAKRLVDAMLGD